MTNRERADNLQRQIDLANDHAEYLQLTLELEKIKSDILREYGVHIADALWERSGR